MDSLNNFSVGKRIRSWTIEMVQNCNFKLLSMCHSLRRKSLKEEEGRGRQKQCCGCGRQASKHTTSRDSNLPKVNTDALTNKLLFCILQSVALVECAEEAIVGMITTAAQHGESKSSVTRARDNPLKCIQAVSQYQVKACLSGVLQPLLVQLCIPLWIVALPISVASLKHFEQAVQIGWHQVDAMR